MSDAFAVLRVAASGMEAQRAALDVAARNVAAAQAAGPGKSYARLVADFALVRDAEGTRVRYAGTHRERAGGADVLTEMIGVMNASRAYDDDAAVFDVGKRLAERTIEMGRL